jgi:hypothetical protein
MLYTLVDDDQIASYRRAQIQGIIDGNAPYNEQQLKEMGQADRVNVNWGHAEAKVENAVIPYFDILTSVGTYATIKTKYGNDMGKREEWSRIISEEFHNMLDRTNPKFLAEHQICQKQLVIHGQACMFWPDSMDFRPKAVEPWQIQVPKGAGVDWQNWEFCFVLDDMYTEELYRYIADEEAASRGGWDVEECKKAIEWARIDEADQRRPWEWYQKEFKNNALYYSYAKSKVIKVAHMYVREYDGRISHYVFDRMNDFEWLCARKSCYKNFSQAFTIYLNGVGNGYYHGVRGLGQKVYKWAEAMNRINNALCEGVIVGSAVMFQPNTAADAEKLKTIQIGPYRILPPGLNVTQVNVSSNLNAAMQTAQMFQSQESDEIGSFLPSVSGGRKKSNKEVEAEIGEKSRLTNTRAEIYLQALDVHYREVYRRASNPNIVEEDHGGPQALEFQQACINRGVPEAALLDILSVKATRSIGQGSSAARMQAMKMIQEYLPQLPESNRKRVINANIAAIAGQTGVETFGIPEEAKPEGNDLSIASLENNAFIAGGQVLIDPDQNHFVHLSVHLQYAASIIDQLQNQRQDPRQASVIFSAMLPHAITHLQYLEQDPTRKEQFEALSEQMGELLKIADQVNSMAEEIQQKEMEAQMEAQQQEPQQDPQMLVAQNKIMLDRAKFQNDAQIKQAKAQHQMALQDRKTAQRLMIDKVKVANKYSSIAP